MLINIPLQARCRGYLVRQLRVRRLKAAVLIQSHVRRLIAQKRAYKLRYERRRMAELRVLKKEEEVSLKKDGVKKYKEEADKNYKVSDLWKQNYYFLIKMTNE